MLSIQPCSVSSIEIATPQFDPRHWEFTDQSYLLRTVPTNSKVFLPRLMIMQEIQILRSAIEIQKENAFFKDN